MGTSNAHRRVSRAANAAAQDHRPVRPRCRDFPAMSSALLRRVTQRRVSEGHREPAQQRKRASIAAQSLFMQVLYGVRFPLAGSAEIAGWGLPSCHLRPASMKFSSEVLMPSIAPDRCTPARHASRERNSLMDSREYPGILAEDPYRQQDSQWIVPQLARRRRRPRYRAAVRTGFPKR